MSDGKGNPVKKLPHLRLPLTEPARLWQRIHQAKYSPLYWNQTDLGRFNHSSAPHGVLYLGADLELCLLETFGDTWINQRSLEPHVSTYTLKQQHLTT